MRPLCTVYKRELAAYFATPLAYIFIVIFLLNTSIDLGAQGQGAPSTGTSMGSEKAPRKQGRE